MKWWLCFLSSSVLWANAFGQKTLPVKEELSNGVLEYHVLKKDRTVKHGPFQETKGTQVVQKGQYIKGEKDGEWSYYASGRLKTVEVFNRGVEIGRSEFKGAYSKNYRRSDDYAETQKVVYTEMYETDTIIHGCYVYDQKVGSWTHYMPWGKLTETQYVGGQKNGKETQWIKGDRQSEKHYSNGVLDGPYIAYWWTGEVPKERCYYDMGVKTAPFSEHYSTGQVRLRGRYKGGRMDGKVSAFYENGEPRFVMNYTKGQLNGPFTVYYDNGSLMMEGIFETGLLQQITKVQGRTGGILQTSLLKDGAGKVTLYSLKEQQSAILIYENGWLNGMQTTFSSGEAIASQAMYSNGIPNGSWIKNGEIETKGTCQNGYRVGSWSLIHADKLEQKTYVITDSIPCESAIGVNGASLFLPPKEIWLEDETVGPVVEDEMPEYYGGDAAMDQFILDHLRYPKKAWRNGIRGVSIVQFTVTEQGLLENIHTDPSSEKKATKAMHEEARRLVRSMPRWKPAFKNGLPIHKSHSIPIRFKLR